MIRRIPWWEGILSPMPCCIRDSIAQPSMIASPRLKAKAVHQSRARRPSVHEEALLRLGSIPQSPYEKLRSPSHPKTPIFLLQCISTEGIHSSDSRKSQQE